MQRAVSVCKLITTTKVEQIREVEIEKLYDLLPHGLTTKLDVDIFGGMIKGPYLLTTSESGTIHSQKHSNDASALSAFSRELISPPPKRPFPLFVHRTPSSQATFHTDLHSLASLWSSTSPDPQSVQHYICPATMSLSILRAHWKAGKRRTMYYILTKKNGGKKGGVRKEGGKLMCLADRVSEWREKGKDGDEELRDKFALCVKSSSECWAVKRIKPIPDINASLSEVRKVIEVSALQPRQHVTEIVCDFAGDREKEWILLKCRGFVFETDRKMFSKSFEQRHKIDLKFILFPLFNQKQLIGQRIRAANKLEESGLNSDDRRISILGISEMRRSKADESREKPLEKTESQKRRISFLHRHSISKDDRAVYSQVVKRYDDMMGDVHRYKMELKGTTNFVVKYGGLGFWDLPMKRFQHHLAEEATLKCFYDQLNFEESRAMLRGYIRVLEGNVNIYYKRSLQLIHQNKSITAEDFFTFLKGIEEMLILADVAPQDCNLIIRRFKSFETFICALRKEGK